MILLLVVSIAASGSVLLIGRTWRPRIRFTVAAVVFLILNAPTVAVMIIGN